MVNENAIKANIKRYREQIGLDEDQMAKRLGVKLRVYKMYESGAKIPGRMVQHHLADIFGITTDELKNE